MARVDPEFGSIDTRLNDPYMGQKAPYPRELRNPRASPALTKKWQQIVNDVQQEVQNVPTPVSDGVGPVTIGKTPSEKIWGDTLAKLSTTYNWTGANQAYGYIERVAPLPAGYNWDGGYGMNRFSALKTLEKQLNFFKQNGKTPLEEALKRFNAFHTEEMKKEYDASRLKSREAELKGLFGGKTRKTRKSKKSRKAKKTRKH